MARVMVGTACHNNKKKSPENWANLPPPGAAGPEKPKSGGAPAWFISHFSLQLELVWPNNIIKECHPGWDKSCWQGISSGNAARRWLWDHPLSRAGASRHLQGEAEEDPSRGFQAISKRDMSPWKVKESIQRTMPRNGEAVRHRTHEWGVVLGPFLEFQLSVYLHFTLKPSGQEEGHRTDVEG